MTTANDYLRLAQDHGAHSCHTATDVWAKVAHVRTFRIQMWPSQRPAAPPPLTPEAPAPVLALPAFFAERGRITIRRVLEVTAAHFGTTIADLLGDGRKRRLCRHRQVAMYLTREMTGRSLPCIGHHMGGRDHTTILHGVRVVRDLLDAGDADTVAAVGAITERLQIPGVAQIGTRGSLMPSANFLPAHTRVSDARPSPIHEPAKTALAQEE